MALTVEGRWRLIPQGTIQLMVGRLQLKSSITMKGLPEIKQGGNFVFPRNT
ncbi:MAG: hypothetical protein AB7T38_14280 [Nitrospirales bacterium]